MGQGMIGLLTAWLRQGGAGPRCLPVALLRGDGLLMRHASAFAGGFVAAEGCFTGTASDPPSFVFSVGLGATDTKACLALQTLLGVGNVHAYARRRPHYDDEVTF